MIFITADTHGELERLTDKSLKQIKKFDTLIVLGDFGFVWSGDKQQEKNLKKISKLPFKVLFIDGYNENFAALEQYPDTVYHGAQAKEICPGQVYYIKRGEVVEVDDMKLLSSAALMTISMTFSATIPHLRLILTAAVPIWKDTAGKWTIY